MAQPIVLRQADRSPLAIRNSWLHDKVFAIPSTKLDWSTKGVVFGISQEFIRRRLPHTQLTKIWYPNIADNSGLSNETVKSCVMKLHKAQAIVKEVKFETDPVTKERKKRVWIAFTPLFIDDPFQLYGEVEESGHGGKRVKRHKGCGGEIVNLCTTCGQTHIPNSETYIDNVDELSQQPDGQTLPTMAELDRDYAYLDASDIPDDIAESMGVENALNASAREIGKYINTPRYIREGLDEE